MNFGLSDTALALIRGVFARHPQVDAVKIFGSRAMGTERANSDIDLALYGAIDQVLLGCIAAELDELPLPYLFDVLDTGRLTHPGLREHIDRHGRLLYSRDVEAGIEPRPIRNAQDPG